MNVRQKHNLLILWRLLRYVAANPDQRFGQVLRNTGVIVDFQRPTQPGLWSEVEWMNHFNEEPAKMLERMNKTQREKR
jgi:hypothetical protein